MKSNLSEPINLENPNEVSILELAEKIKEISSSCNEIVFSDLPLVDPLNRKPDIEKAKKLLQWELANFQRRWFVKNL